MPLKLLPVTHDSDFLELARIERLAFETPSSQLVNLYFPLFPEGPSGRPSASAREASIKEAAERQIMWHRSDPSSTWIKVVDEGTGEMLGAALWHVYEKDPYSGGSEDGEEHGCTWFAEGEDRDVANALIGQFFEPRMTYMTRPHVFLDIFFTVPSARRQGVAAMMMKWGVDEADRRQLPSYIDATAMGRQQYLKWGFVEEKRREFSLDGFPRTESLRVLEGMLIPFEWWPMFRGVGGKGGEEPWREKAA